MFGEGDLVHLALFRWCALTNCMVFHNFVPAIVLDYDLDADIAIVKWTVGFCDGFVICQFPAERVFAVMRQDVW